MNTSSTSKPSASVENRQMEYIFGWKKIGVSLILRVSANFVGKVTEIVGDFVNC